MPKTFEELEIGDVVIERETGDALKALDWTLSKKLIFLGYDLELDSFSMCPRDYFEREFIIPEPEPKEWRPREWGGYFFVGSDGEVEDTYFNPISKFDLDRFEAGNCYRAHEEALVAAKRVKTAYRGV